MPIDFGLSAALEEIRATTRDFIENVANPVEKGIDPNGRTSLIAGSIERREAAQERGTSVPHLPKEWGGTRLGHAIRPAGLRAIGVVLAAVEPCTVSIRRTSVHPSAGSSMMNAASATGNLPL